MSVKVNYKGEEILSVNTDTTKTLKTSGKYCEADIEVINTPDGGGAPVINPLSVTENGTYNAPSGVDGYSPVTVNVPQGITPTGNINITDTNPTDVTNYATAQVVDADLVASNIKEGVNILGILGTFAGGGSLPTSISKIDGGSFTFAVDSKNNEISHNLGVVPEGFVVWTEDAELRNATAATDSYLLSAYVDCLNFTGGTGGATAYAVQPSIFYKRANGNVSVTGNPDATLSKWASTNYFKITTSSVSYKANTTYKWIAWA